MSKSKVYFTDFSCKANGDNLLKKIEKLVKSAGIESIDFKDKFTAIKIHFGELGNLAYLRPNYSKVIIDIIKDNEGKPFLTDCSTLYVGSRKNAVDHLDTAYVNGYNPFATGAHVIIADGLKGTDDVHVKIDKELVKDAKIGRAIVDSDILISLNHFKMHESTGIGGALKNIGMGCGSRAGKMEMHSGGKTQVGSLKCVGCMKCVSICAHDAINKVEGKAYIDVDKCVGCSRCSSVCPVDAISACDFGSNDDLNKKISEYSYAILKDKPSFHITLVMDVSPFCDCHAENDRAVVPDVGMFASFDPVALDVACAEMVNKQPILKDSLLYERKCKCDSDDTNEDYFKCVHSQTNWRVMTDHAEKLGLGNSDYELIKIG